MNSNSNRYFTMKDCTEVYAWVDGQDNDKSVVLIHGWGLSHLMWESQISYLTKQGYCVVAIDLRGFGNSGDSKTDYSYQTWANDIREVIAQLGLKDVTLVGFSIGGATAMCYVGKNVGPAVDRLTLVAATGPNMLQSSNNPDGLALWELQGAITVFENIPFGTRSIDDWFRKQAFDKFLEVVFGIKQPKAKTPLYDRLYEMFKSASKEAVIGGLKEMRDRDLTEALSHIRVDTMILHGKSDIFVRPDLAKKQEQRLTGAPKKTLKWYDYTGHEIVFVRGDHINKELDAFAR